MSGAPPAGPGSPADNFVERMLIIARGLMQDPGRAFTIEETDLFVKGARALAEMFVEMDQRLREGAPGPVAWGGQVNPDIPTSSLHERLKAAADAGVMHLLNDFAKLGNKTGLRLMNQLQALMVTLSRFTSESVRLASVNRLDAAPGAGNPTLMVLQRPEEPVTKSGRSVDQEND